MSVEGQALYLIVRWDLFTPPATQKDGQLRKAGLALTKTLAVAAHVWPTQCSPQKGGRSLLVEADEARRFFSDRHISPLLAPSPKTPDSPQSPKLGGAGGGVGWRKMGRSYSVLLPNGALIRRYIHELILTMDN
ncbi:hypothetical protein E2C01_019836 [Portunus trituberculatus]|uniref:Uncharacterized protein n=1 Tax=Portunus trituberculatus TaxID=210409 RepID=A0A5B7DZX8_PORTR|nr:hypothetical protein [Portunus trituberculatus]